MKSPRARGLGRRDGGGGGRSNRRVHRREKLALGRSDGSLARHRPVDTDWKTQGVLNCSKDLIAREKESRPRTCLRQKVWRIWRFEDKDKDRASARWLVGYCLLCVVEELRMLQGSSTSTCSTEFAWLQWRSAEPTNWDG